jgi:tetratricopeptide (TPR) repeat protein
MPLGTAKDPAAEERAARAMAAMNIDFAALAASSTPGKRQSSWLLPAVVVVALVAMMFVGLGMLRRMSAHSAGSAVPGEQAELAGVNPAIARPPGGSNTPLDAPMPGAQAIQAENPAEAGSDPADAEFHARFQRANALQEAGDWSGLVEHAKAWAAAQPDRMEPQHFLGIAYSRLGQHDAAAEALTKVLQHDPTQEGARNLLADTFLQAQRWPEAAAIYKQLVVQKPDNSRIWNNYGAALVGLGEKEQAVAALETAVRLDPSFKQAWQNLGTLYQQTGDQAKASAAFANAH